MHEDGQEAKVNYNVFYCAQTRLVARTYQFANQNANQPNVEQPFVPGGKERCIFVKLNTWIDGGHRQQNYEIEMRCEICHEFNNWNFGELMTKWA